MQNRMKQLVEILNKYAHEYYVLDNPTVSDAHYDSLYDELVALEKQAGTVLPNSPTRRVGGEVLTGFKQHVHISRLYSLDKCKTFEQLLQWDEKVKKAVGEDVKYTLEYKLDGLTLCVTYKNGQLVTAATRGNGSVGEDVTAQVLTIKSVPLSIPFAGVVEVQGEGIMKLSAFEKYNKTAAEPLKNPRNGVAGAIRNLDPAVTARRNLDIIFYNINYIENGGSTAPKTPDNYDLLYYNTTPTSDGALGLGAGLESGLKSDLTADAKAVSATDAGAGAATGREAYSVDFAAESGESAAATQSEILTQAQMLDFLKVNGFLTNPPFAGGDIESIIKQIKGVDREALDFAIDGMVIKVDSLKMRKTLGYTDKFPRWAIAFKFEAEEADTTLLDVTWNVGRTGKLTPLATLEPVELSGATVRRATLNNFGDITRKGVKIGCRVFIRRSNDVIPEVLGVAGDSGGTQIEKPVFCPACGAEIFEDGAHIFCPNTEGCPPQICARIEHFAAKECMDIEGLSTKTVQSLCDVLGVKNIAELYSLSAADLAKLDGFKDKKISNLLKGIEDSKRVDLPHFISALGIPNVGTKLARDLARRFKSIINLAGASEDELSAIPDIGEVTAGDIVHFFARNADLIAKLKEVGIDPQFADTKEGKEGAFSGKKIVLTGTLMTFTRAQAATEIEKRGGEIQSSVTKATDLVIAGDSAGSKLKKAQELSIKIIDENEFADLLDD